MAKRNSDQNKLIRWKAAVATGNTLLNRGKFRKAANAYGRALRIQPDPVVYNRLGDALQKLRQLADAIRAYRRALNYAPDAVKAHTYANLGNALLENCEFEKAVEAYREVAVRKPIASAFCSLGSLLSYLGQFNEVTNQFEEALRRDPGNAQIKWQRAAVRLTNGDFQGGWEDCLSRINQDPRRLQGFSGDKLSADLGGRRLYLEREQGLGDEVFFSQIYSFAEGTGCMDQLSPTP